MKNQINEISTNRLLKHFQDENTFAIISTYRTERTEAENKKLLLELKTKIKKMKLGFTELLSKWVEKDPETNKTVSSDERSLMIYSISLNDAIKLGKEYDQSSIIYKNKEKCAEICTVGFEDFNGKKHDVGNVVRTFKTNDSKTPLNLNIAKEIFSDRLGGPVSKPIKSNRAFTLFEIESPRGTVFSNSERLMRIF